MLLVTGHPRSGTYYTCKFLRMLGMSINHEYYGHDGIVSWHLGAINMMNQKELIEIIDRSIKAHIIDGHESIDSIASVTTRFIKIIHQVRNPIKVISSSQTMAAGSWAFMKRYIELPATTDLIILATYSWVRWNQLIETLIKTTNIECLRMRAEEIDNIYTTLCDFVGFKNSESIPEISKKINTRDYQMVSMSDIKNKAPEIVPELISLADKYGYSLPSH